MDRLVMVAMMVVCVDRGLQLCCGRCSDLAAELPEMPQSRSSADGLLQVCPQSHDADTCGRHGCLVAVDVLDCGNGDRLV